MYVFEFLLTRDFEFKMKWIVMIIFNGNLYQSEKKNISNLNLYKQILNCFSYCKQKPAWIIEI